ncbi:MAG TPA: hypothetical protein VEI02_16475 [Planctomycetota bacterium]|nr:hypothetical protein [Planctomycetota bacterium]
MSDADCGRTSELFDGVGPANAARRGAATTHLVVCAECRARWAPDAALIEALATTPSATAPPVALRAATLRAARRRAGILAAATAAVLVARCAASGAPSTPRGVPPLTSSSPPPSTQPPRLGRGDALVETTTRRMPEGGVLTVRNTAPDLVLGDPR